MTLRIKRMHVFSKPLRLPALRFYLNNYTGKNNLYYYLPEKYRVYFEYGHTRMLGGCIV